MAALEVRPFTCAFGFLLAMSLVATLVYLFDFSDSEAEFQLHFWQSFEVIIVLATGFGFFLWRERKSPLPLRFRRWFWYAIVCGYAGLAGYFSLMLFQPYARFQLFRAIISLGAVLPVPFMAWRLIRKNAKG